ncbi:uncharacterized protein BKA78DRAFT_357911 [Phyllosticta capitalensis]|uniref:uncharacterized protein n=1 Tax=Phyllosticta capitalensis TaxID=121624 RepID=UPI00312F5EDD
MDKTQNAGDLPLRSQTQQQECKGCKAPCDNITLKSHTASSTTVSEGLIVNKTQPAFQQEEMPRASDPRTNSEMDTACDTDIHKQSTQSREILESTHSKPGHPASTRFEVKPKRFAGFKISGTQGSKNNKFPYQGHDAVHNDPTTSESTLVTPHEAIPLSRQDLDPHRGSISRNVLIASGVQIGGAISNIDSPVPSRNTTTVTRFSAPPDNFEDELKEASALPDDHTVKQVPTKTSSLPGDNTVEEKSTNVSPLEDEDTTLEDLLLLQEVLDRSRGRRGRKTVFGLFPGQDKF